MSQNIFQLLIRGITDSGKSAESSNIIKINIIQLADIIPEDVAFNSDIQSPVKFSRYPQCLGKIIGTPGRDVGNARFLSHSHHGLDHMVQCSVSAAA